MATISASLSMSLDGFIASPGDTVEHIFDWYDAGEVAVPWPGNPMVSHVTPPSAAHLREVIEGAGAIVSGRRLFDHTDGWGGTHPAGVPVVVVTHSRPETWVEAHPDAPFTFVTDGVERAVAVAAEIAGPEGTVGVAGANVAQQCLAAGLLDEICVDLAPVLLGEGIRFFEAFDTGAVLLDDPRVVEGTRVTHLRYRIRR